VDRGPDPLDHDPRGDAGDRAGARADHPGRGTGAPRQRHHDRAVATLPGPTRQGRSDDGLVLVGDPAGRPPGLRLLLRGAGRAVPGPAPAVQVAHRAADLPLEGPAARVAPDALLRPVLRRPRLHGHRAFAPPSPGVQARRGARDRHGALPAGDAGARPGLRDGGAPVAHQGNRPDDRGHRRLSTGPRRNPDAGRDRRHRGARKPGARRPPAGVGPGARRRGRGPVPGARELQGAARASPSLPGQPELLRDGLRQGGG
jgi:hypothetical protein